MSRRNRLTLAEQETIILWDNELDIASVYTHDQRIANKLKELAKAPGLKGISSMRKQQLIDWLAERWEAEVKKQQEQKEAMKMIPMQSCS